MNCWCEHWPSSLKTGVVTRCCRTRRSLSKGHTTWRQTRNSLTCFASSHSFCSTTNNTVVLEESKATPAVKQRVWQNVEAGSHIYKNSQFNDPVLCKNGWGKNLQHVNTPKQLFVSFSLDEDVLFIGLNIFDKIYCLPQKPCFLRLKRVTCWDTGVSISPTGYFRILDFILK